MKWFSCVADTMEGLNGFLNTGTYLIQSRQWRQQHRGAMIASAGNSSRGSSQRGSFHACFDPTAAVILIPSTDDDERCRSPYISDIYRTHLHPIGHDYTDPTPKSPRPSAEDFPSYDSSDGSEAVSVQVLVEQT